MVAAVFHVCLFFWVKIIFPRLCMCIYWCRLYYIYMFLLTMMNGEKKIKDEENGVYAAVSDDEA